MADHTDFELGRIEDEGNGSGKMIGFIIVAAIVFIGSGFALWSNRAKLEGIFQTNKTNPQAQAMDLQGAIDFADNFVVAYTDFSYMNIENQVQRVASMCSDDLANSYSKHFLDQEFRKKLADRRAYVTYEKVRQSTVEAEKKDDHGDQVIVRVSGVNRYHSDVTDSEIEIPFSYDIVVKKTDTGYQVVNMARAI